VARDQRTRLNAELAHQYNGQKKGTRPAPGRSALTSGLTEQPAELEEEQQEGEGEEDGAALAEPQQEQPKKSLFELPRKEPSRQPLLGATSSLTDPPPAPAAPATPAGKPPTRRG